MIRAGKRIPARKIEYEVVVIMKIMVS